MLNSRRSLLACVAVATLAVLVLVAVLDASPSSPDKSSPKPKGSAAQPTVEPASSCPRALDPGPRAPEGVLRALRAAVPRTWHYGRADRKRLKLSAENTLVRDLQSLGGDSRHLPRFSSYYGKLARRKCGDTVALRTWVAVVYFPTSQAADYAERFAFFARTRTGWKLWYHD
jgi:hypothetical protein